MKTSLLATLPLLLAVPAATQLPWGSDRCDHRAERSATVSAAGAELLRLAAEAGSLRIEGRPGISEVRVRGEACASDARSLERIELRAERVGGEVRVETVMPEQLGSDDFSARLDLVVEVPESLPLDVEDSSGSLEARGVAALRLRDSSGEIEVADVRGGVEIDDGSGEIRLSGVGGDVRLRDSSGDLEVREVAGSVLVESDGSGEVRVSEVERDVRIDRDASGSISVAGVRGDFVVARDGSGGIRHRDVGGEVRIPSRR